MCVTVSQQNSLVSVLYTHKDINNNSITNTDTGGVSFQIQTGLLISDFSPWQHKERDTIFKSLC